MAPKPPPRWTKPPTGKQRAPKTTAAPIVVTPSASPRRRWPWVAIALVVGVGAITAGTARFVTDLDRPPSSDQRIDEHHILKWEDRGTELVEGLLSMESGRPAVTLHFGSGADDIVYRLTGK